MPVVEPSQPQIELCERAWKLLARLGKQHKHVTDYDLEGRYHIRSFNQHIIIREFRNPAQGGSVNLDTFIVLNTDELGKPQSYCSVACNRALEVFRRATVLDDLADING